MPSSPTRSKSLSNVVVDNTASPVYADPSAKPNSTRLTWIFGALIFLLIGALIVGRGGHDTSKQARIDRIAADVKCPTCQGLSVGQSKAESARLIYDEIARQVASGKTDGEIRSYLVTRYGQGQFLRPDATGIASIAWIAPIVALVLALAGLILAFRRWGRRSIRALTDDDELVVAAALRRSRSASDAAKVGNNHNE
jgi:cytochrome c-type biogenesis protein CcmH/NrfF